VVAIGFALLSACGYGVADFLAGIAARRSSVIRISLIVYAAGAVAILLVLPFWHPGRFLPGSVLWGVVSGSGAGAGALALAAGFRRAPFSIAGPLSAVIGAGLSVVAGLALGDRPGTVAWIGLALAMPAILAVSMSATGSRREMGGWPGIRYGVLAGLGCAVSLIGMAQTRTASGVWPVLSIELSALLTVGVVSAFTGDLHLPSRASMSPSVWSGALGMAAAICYLLAAHSGTLAIVAVVTSLFPAVTVGLAVLLTGERLGAIRLVGLGLAVISVSLIALGG
jgi:drug/metabolite transporter (DMT)-like permease